MFFFGFFSTIIPYIATILVMAAYMLLGITVKAPETTVLQSNTITITTDNHTLEIGSHNNHHAYYSQHQQAATPPTISTTKGKNKLLLPLPSSLLNSQRLFGLCRSNKAPPCLI